MTWRQWQTARQLLAEEAIGADQRQARALEDAKYARTMDIVRRSA